MASRRVLACGCAWVRAWVLHVRGGSRVIFALSRLLCLPPSVRLFLLVLSGPHLDGWVAVGCANHGKLIARWLVVD